MKSGRRARLAAGPSPGAFFFPVSRGAGAELRGARERVDRPLFGDADCAFDGRALPAPAVSFSARSSSLNERCDCGPDAFLLLVSLLPSPRLLCHTRLRPLPPAISSMVRPVAAE